MSISALVRRYINGDKSVRQQLMAAVNDFLKSQRWSSFGIYDPAADHEDLIQSFIADLDKHVQSLVCEDSEETEANIENVERRFGSLFINNLRNANTHFSRREKLKTNINPDAEYLRHRSEAEVLEEHLGEGVDPIAVRILELYKPPTKRRRGKDIPGTKMEGVYKQVADEFQLSVNQVVFRYDKFRKFVRRHITPEDLSGSAV